MLVFAVLCPSAAQVTRRLYSGIRLTVHPFLRATAFAGRGVNAAAMEIDVGFAPLQAPDEL